MSVIHLNINMFYSGPKCWTNGPERSTGRPADIAVPAGKLLAAGPKTRHVSSCRSSDCLCGADVQPAYLYVDVGPVVDQELQAERPVCGGGSKVQRGEALVVGLADVGAVIDQLADDSVLTVETGHVERRVPKRIGLIYLLSERTRLAIMANGRCLCQCCYAFSRMRQ